MHFCCKKRHVWNKKADAEKCCNGFKRAIVFGADIPANTPRVKFDEQSGVSYARIWVKSPTPVNSTHI